MKMVDEMEVEAVVVEVDGKKAGSLCGVEVEAVVVVVKRAGFLFLWNFYFLSPVKLEDAVWLTTASIVFARGREIM